MGTFRTCDGVTRRDALHAGAVGSLTLAGMLRLSHAGQVAPSRARSAIFIDLQGGPSHLDSLDLKPQAPSEIRGTFNPISTNVPGIEICEHLPKLAGCADKYAIVRGVSHTLGAHPLGQQYINTGNRPLPSLEYPGYGAVVAKELAAEPDLPPSVAIPTSNQAAGFLGVQYAPLNTNAVPQPGRPFGVRGISLQGGVTIQQIEKRNRLLRDLDQTFHAVQQDDQLLAGLDQFSQQAFDVITSRRTRLAFDISQESESFSRPFGGDAFGQSCLLATRLIEAGVRFVTITLGGWDTHANNFTRLKDQLLPRLDVGLAALLGGLEQKGLLSSTTVLVTGEFGRTPKINSRSSDGGRDHYPRCMCMLMAGGPVRVGQVVGESDDTASAPRNEVFSPDDMAATFYYCLGIDSTKEYHTNTGRPVMIVREGAVVKKLVS